MKSLPETTEQVIELVRHANEHGVALVPSGGRTGLSGGATARNGELVVSFERMNRILDFDPIGASITCQPGVITQTLQEYALEQGLYYPVDFASRGSSQIGGNIATNAGGIKVIRYGLTRNRVSGLKVITGKGELLACFDGSISAEHGVGLSKKPYLGYTRSELEIDYLRALKRLFDPNGILNPGKIFDSAPTRS